LDESVDQNQTVVVIRAVSLLVGVGVTVFIVWFGVDGLVSGDEEVWFAITVLAMAPVLFGAGVVVPSVLRTHSQDELTLRIAQPFPSLCLSAAMFIGCLALSAALGGGWWYLAGIVVGALVANGEVASMKQLREMTERKLAGEPPVQRPDSDYSKTEIVSVAVRSVLSVSVTIIVLTGFAYVTLGGTAAIVACSAMLLLMASLYAVTLARIRARRRDHNSV
jgi:hypothetical protein